MTPSKIITVRITLTMAYTFDNNKRLKHSSKLTRIFYRFIFIIAMTAMMIMKVMVIKIRTTVITMITVIVSVIVLMRITA